MDDLPNDRFMPLTQQERATVPAGVATAAQDDGELVSPVPTDAPDVPATHARLGRPTATWTYRDASGAVLFEVWRFDPPGERKQFLPLSLWRDTAGLRWRWKGVPALRPLYCLDKLVASPEAPVVVCEGEKAADAAQSIFPKSVCVTSPDGSQAAAKADWSPPAGRKILVWPDADEPGARYAVTVAGILYKLVCDVSIIDAAALASIDPNGGNREPPQGWDAADAADEWQDLAALRKAAHGLAKPFEPGPEASAAADGQAWPKPKPLPDGLLPVAPFDPAFLPEAIAPWVMDIAERMQCPPDFVGIPAMIALGSVIGRRLGVRPQRKTDWIEVPNLWGCIVGRPGLMKSPAMSEALKPLHRLEADARKENEAAAKDFAIASETFKLQKDEAAKKVRTAIRNGDANAAHFLELDQPEAPKARRYVVNDTTYEALGEVLADNPNGTLAYRDELVSLLKTLDSEEYAPARGFFLSAWSGTMGYSFDRITRGRTHIEAACLSLLGSTQPGRLAEYMRRANAGGAGDDGLIQRFGLLVWPDHSSEWREVDRYPDSAARTAAWGTFERLDKMDPDAIGAERDSFESLPFLHFDADAQGVFAEWRSDLEARLRAGDLSPALESHFAKYRKLVPALALINHLADGGADGISENSILRALALAGYLETQAKRAYSAGSEIETSAAKAILARIRKGDLSDGFTGRDVHRPRWSNLSDHDHVQAGLDLLADLDWLFAAKRETGGRPSIAYRINPRGLP